MGVCLSLYCDSFNLWNFPYRRNPYVISTYIYSPASIDVWRKSAVMLVCALTKTSMNNRTNMRRIAFHCITGEKNSKILSL